MRLPTPTVGLVIGVDFLWRHQHVRGETSGRKARPCVVVTALRRSADGAVVVAVSPITTKRPEAGRTAVALSSATRRRLGLHAPESYVVTDELNEFVWPGSVLAPFEGRWALGELPRPAIERVKAEVLAAFKEDRLRRVPR